MPKKIVATFQQCGLPGGGHRYKLVRLTNALTIQPLGQPKPFSLGDLLSPEEAKAVCHDKCVQTVISADI